MEAIPTPRGGKSREAEVSADRQGVLPSEGSAADKTVATDARVNLLGMPRAELQAFFVALGEKPYRASQVMKWIYHAGIDDFHAMTDISKALRARLDGIAEIRAPEFGPARRAADGVVKWPVLVGSGQAVEAVLIPDAPGDGPSRRKTLCISSQVGCVLDCSFCATGKRGFNGNLSRAEIVGQVWRARNAGGRWPDACRRRRPQHHQRGVHGDGRAAVELRRGHRRRRGVHGRPGIRHIQAPGYHQHRRCRAAHPRPRRGQRRVAGPCRCTPPGTGCATSSCR